MKVFEKQDLPAQTELTTISTCRVLPFGRSLVAISDSDVQDLDLWISIYFLVEPLAPELNDPDGSYYVVLPSQSFVSLLKDL